MRVFIFAVIIILITGVSFVVFKKPKNDVFVDLTDQSTVNIVLTKTGFEPDKFIIKKGTEVVFSTNTGKQYWPASNLHPSHGIYSEFDPKHPIEPNNTWSFVFDRVGLWGMHDHIRSYYVGEIKVVE